MVEFGNQRHDWLKEVLDLPNGIPSHDTFNRVLQVIDPEQLSTCLAQDGDVLIESLEGKQVNFDGNKTKGASPKSRGNKGSYILSPRLANTGFVSGKKRYRIKAMRSVRFQN